MNWLDRVPFFKERKCDINKGDSVWDIARKQEKYNLTSEQKAINKLQQTTIEQSATIKNLQETVNDQSETINKLKRSDAKQSVTINKL